MLLGQLVTIGNQSKFYHKPYTKIKPRSIADINMKVEIIKLLEYNIGEHHYSLQIREIPHTEQKHSS